MHHRKIQSQGHIPFSWEEKPGIPKSNHHKSSSDIGNHLKILSESDINAHLIPPPPCTIQPRRRSYTGRRWEDDDPFMAALKFCKKNLGGYEEEKKNVFKEKNLNKGSTVFFSCKQSCDVENDNLVKFSKLPPIPKERYSAKSFVRN